MAGIAYPLINGVRFDHSSLDIKIAGVSFFGVKSIDYSDQLERGKVYGTGAQKIGRTRGQYDADASIELYRAEADQFLQLLAQQTPNTGLYEITFNIDVTYLAEGGLSPVTDNIVGCYIKKSPRTSAAGGTDAIAIKYDLDIMYVLQQGLAPITKFTK